MKREDIDTNLPDAPGVYRFIGPRREVLYVGKATSLQDRVKSYFVKNLAAVRSPLVAKIIADACSVEIEETDSVLEALILEAALIKKYQPIGNTEGKDNKSWNYVVITKETFPRVLVARERELSTTFSHSTIAHLYGPFPSAGQLRAALKIIRKIFPFFDTKFPLSENLSAAQQKTVRFNQSLGLYPRELNAKEYRKTIRAIRDIFSTKKQVLVTRLEKEMRTLAAAERFEEAEVLKRKIFALQHIHDISLIKEDLRTPTTAAFRIEAYDTAHTRGKAPRGVMTVLVDGEVAKEAYRTFTITNAKAGDDYAALDEIISRRARHPEWRFPQLVVIDGGKAHLARAKKALKEAGIAADVVAVVKDEKHRPREILGPGALTITHEPSILLANAEAHRFALGRHRQALRKAQH